MTTSIQNQSADTPLHPAWNIAIFSAVPIVAASAVATFTYGLSNGDVTTSMYHAKLAGVFAGTAMTILEGAACFYIGFGESEYSSSYDERYPVNQTERQIAALKTSWAGVAISAFTLAAVGYFGPEDKTQHQSTPEKQAANNSATGEVKIIPDTYQTANGYVLSLA